MALALYPWQQPLAESLNRMRSEMPNGLLIYGPGRCHERSQESVPRDTHSPDAKPPGNFQS